MRSLERHRENLVRYRSVHIQHMQKALQLMNLLLTQVVSDITGLTGLKIIRSIVAGERDPETLAQHRHASCKRSQAEIGKALKGNYRPEHLYKSPLHDDNTHIVAIVLCRFREREYGHPEPNNCIVTSYLGSLSGENQL